MKISRTPYYSSSWDVPILLYESLEILKWLKMPRKSFIEAAGAPKMTSAKIRPIINFFRRGCAIFILIFGRAKTYKPKNPSGWHYLLDEPSPEMDSNPNLNEWTSISSPIQILSLTAGKHTFKMKISRTPYYSSSWNVPILLYEILKYWNDF